MAKLVQGLNGAFAEGRCAHHNATTIILNGTGEDFRRRGREAVHQHGQRAVVHGACFAVAVQLNAALGVAYLHGGATVDKQADQRVSFLERTAAVITQI